MTLGTFLLMILTLYLVLIAYGVVGARRKFSGRPLLLVQGLLVLVLPVALVLAMLFYDERDILIQWLRLFIAMPILGVIVAILADRIARKVAP
jgi:Mn2+/Fe2+ NRAMP family transporter